MVATNLDAEVKKAFECVRNGKNFILEGGAGSGKTYSLVSLMNALLDDNPNLRIVCITYTNNAVAEILSRVDNENIIVSTIHEFMWSIINKYQNEIKVVLVDLINECAPEFKKPNLMESQNLPINYFDEVRVEYDEYYSITPDPDTRIVTISHNHILYIAERMFCKYIKLQDIFKDIANCIFVDEYQDTDKKVAKILLDYLKPDKKKTVVGFFGDSMQAIYDSGIGDLKDYNLEKIVKEQNRRNPQTVIDVANKIRSDGIKQKPSDDVNAPNMEGGKIREGSVKFLYGQSELNFESDFFNGWDFQNSSETKVLYLTHQLNSDKVGFKELYRLYNNDLIFKLVSKINEKYDNQETEETLDELALKYNIQVKKVNLRDLIQSEEIYNNVYQKIKNMPFKEVYRHCKINKDSLMAFKFNGLTGAYEANSTRDRILRRLDVLEEAISYYKEGQYNEFLRMTQFKVECKEDKNTLKNGVSNLLLDNGQSIETVLSSAENLGLLKKDELFDEYINGRGFYLWLRIKEIGFQEYLNSIDYLKGHLPFSTQHSVKGSEFDNVLIILESKWNKYNFDTLFKRTTSNENVVERTKKLFYVCITRAKKNLVVYMPTDDSTVIHSAQELFGKDNVISIDSNG